MNILQKAAEILVECGYADKLGYMENGNAEVIRTKLFHHVEPFADTLEGRRQADAIEDWLWERYLKIHTEGDLWGESINIEQESTKHQWRLDRIKWCLEELIK